MFMPDTPDDRIAPQITVLLQPEGREFSLLRPKTVLQLLRKLDIRSGTALIIRDGGLLTQDCQILPGDHITVRIVTSSG
jgi:sulfur carrier protein